ncbi:LysR family transcriptional regulator [Geoalkalibacter sp.]|uniref:LysR family transcriptional regulator n=1 Tax=Geoalkalibacter sp. TaxID=3041440 RepID=UPI00272EA70C|nr:LysR family transcriptional regulator [Geoalkalibacter sp.]
MELNQLKSFLTIARERNLTRAADQLNLSQSALSTQLKQLEGELGVSLFRRTARGMELSEHGGELLPLAEEVLDMARRLRRRAMELHQGVGESLCIGLNTAPDFLRVSAINRRLSLLHADLNVVYHTSETLRTADLLRQGRLDLAFFYGNAADADIRHLLLAWIRICVVIPRRLAPEGATLTWENVAALPWIWVANDSPLYAALLDKLERLRLQPNQAVTAADEFIVRALFLDGQGVAVMREDEARPLAAEGQARIWEQGWMTLPLSLAWLEKNDGKKKIRAGREVIRHIWQSELQDAGDTPIHL